MAMDANTLKTMILSAFPNATVHIEDLAGDGDHYSAHVISADFIGKTRIHQHQMVYQALQGKMGTELHALALKTSVPES